jgi:hypothetical protein
MQLVGLIVEGIYDEAALTEFVRKCLSTEVNVICRPCGGVPQLMKLFPGFLKEFEHVNSGLPVDKGIVIRDADQKTPEALISQMENKISGRRYLFPTKFRVIVQELETWLLADEEAYQPSLVEINADYLIRRGSKILRRDFEKYFRVLELIIPPR